MHVQILIETNRIKAMGAVSVVSTMWNYHHQSEELKYLDRYNSCLVVAVVVIIVVLLVLLV